MPVDKRASFCTLIALVLGSFGANALVDQSANKHIEATFPVTLDDWRLYPNSNRSSATVFTVPAQLFRRYYSRPESAHVIQLDINASTLGKGGIEVLLADGKWLRHPGWKVDISTTSNERAEPMRYHSWTQLVDSTGQKRITTSWIELGESVHTSEFWTKLLSPFNLFKRDSSYALVVASIECTEIECDAEASVLKDFVDYVVGTDVTFVDVIMQEKAQNSRSRAGES